MPPASRPATARERSAALVLALALFPPAVAATSWTSWRFAGPLPCRTAAVATAVAAMPGAEVAHVVRRDVLFAAEDPGTNPVLGGDDYEAGYVEVVLHLPASAGPAAAPTDGAALVTAMGGRLAGAGWTVGLDRLAGPVDVLVARRAGQYLEAYPSTSAAGPDGGGAPVRFVTVTLERAEPAYVLPASCAGGILGLLLGVLVAPRLLRLAVRCRYRRAVRAAAVLAGVGACLLAPGGLLVAVDVALHAAAAAAGLAGWPEVSGPDPLWGPYTLFGVRALTWAGAALTALAAIVPSLVAVGARVRRRGDG